MAHCLLHVMTIQSSLSSCIHDKKNRGNEINVTLLGGIGDVRINQSVSENEVKEALDFVREG